MKQERKFVFSADFPATKILSVSLKIRCDQNQMQTLYQNRIEGVSITNLRDHIYRKPRKKLLQK